MSDLQSRNMMTFTTWINAQERVWQALASNACCITSNLSNFILFDVAPLNQTAGPRIDFLFAHVLPKDRVAAWLWTKCIKHFNKTETALSVSLNPCIFFGSHFQKHQTSSYFLLFVMTNQRVHYEHQLLFAGQWELPANHVLKKLLTFTGVKVLNLKQTQPTPWPHHIVFGTVEKKWSFAWQIQNTWGFLIFSLLSNHPSFKYFGKSLIQELASI